MSIFSEITLFFGKKVMILFNILIFRFSFEIDIKDIARAKLKGDFCNLQPHVICI